MKIIKIDNIIVPIKIDKLSFLTAVGARILAVA